MSIWALADRILNNYSDEKRIKEEILKDPVSAAVKGHYLCQNCGKLQFGKNLDKCQKCGAKFQISSEIQKGADESERGKYPKPSSYSKSEKMTSASSLESIIRALWGENPEFRRKANIELMRRAKFQDVMEWIRRCDAGPVDCNHYEQIDNREKITHEEIVDFLFREMNNADPDIRNKSIQAFFWVKSEKAIDPIFQALNDNETMTSAVSALRETHPERLLKALIKITIEDSDEKVRERAARSIPRIEPDSVVNIAIEAFSKYFQKGEKKVQINAIVALGKLESEKANDILIKILKNNDKDIRLKAIEALEFIGSESSVEPLFLTMLKDIESDVRESAASTIFLINSKNSVTIQISPDEQTGRSKY